MCHAIFFIVFDTTEPTIRAVPKRWKIVTTQTIAYIDLYENISFIFKTCLDIMDLKSTILFK